MSGHSKWHNIQGRKGKQDKMRSGMFTKYAKLIAVAAREGGGDMGMNFNLRLLVDKAKAVNMPKDNIERAIKRGTGELNDGTQLEEVVYEGFGPGGVGVMVETVTDNKNRTGGESMLRVSRTSVKRDFTMYIGVPPKSTRGSNRS
jgi:YebC/PmpR family DNA-binding regulatory protein